MTPRKFKALLDVHMKFMNAQNGVETQSQPQTAGGYIDQIPGW